jgi:hypothetical protein
MYPHTTLYLSCAYKYTCVCIVYYFTMPAYVSIRQHTSAYVSVRQHYAYTRIQVYVCMHSILLYDASYNTNMCPHTTICILYICPAHTTIRVYTYSFRALWLVCFKGSCICFKGSCICFKGSCISFKGSCISLRAHASVLRAHASVLRAHASVLRAHASVLRAHACIYGKLASDRRLRLVCYTTYADVR